MTLSRRSKILCAASAALWLLVPVAWASAAETEDEAAYSDPALVESAVRRGHDAVGRVRVEIERFAPSRDGGAPDAATEAEAEAETGRANSGERPSVPASDDSTPNEAGSAEWASEVAPAGERDANGDANGEANGDADREASAEVGADVVRTHPSEPDRERVETSKGDDHAETRTVSGDEDETVKPTLVVPVLAPPVSESSTKEPSAVDAIQADTATATPSEEIPTETLPTDALPSGAPPSGVVPSGSVSSETVPSERVPSGTVPSETNNADVIPTPELREPPAQSEPRPRVILGSVVAPGQQRRLVWSGIESFAGVGSATPVLVAHGSEPGPTLCLTAAVHGDELNGIEIVRRVMEDVDASKLAGTVIGVPIVNVHGFQRASRYLPDRRDLNRFFPGDAHGSSASRIADSFFRGVVRHCDWLVDLHTGSFHRTNLTQLRADIRHEGVRELCRGFGDMVVLHRPAMPGTLRRAAIDAGVPTVTVEAGEPMRLEVETVERGVAGINNLMGHLGMVRELRLFRRPQPVYYRSTWVRADRGGILISTVRLGDFVQPGELLGTVTDPVTNLQTAIEATVEGRVLGMAVNQFVLPGYAVFRIGIETSGEGEIAEALAEGTDSGLEDGDEADDDHNEGDVELDERPE